MLELLLEYPFLPVYALTVLVAIWKYRLYFDTPLRFFPVILMYTLVNEILGTLIREYGDVNLFISELYTTYNWIIYNIYFLVFFLYFFRLYYRYFTRKKERKLLLAGIGIYTLVSLIDPFIYSFFLEMQLTSVITGSCLLIICAAAYLRQVHRNTGNPLGPGNLLSWLSLGIGLFFLCYIPIALIRHFHSLALTNPSPWVFQLLKTMIFVEYGCFLIGFITMRKMKAPQESNP